LAKATGFTAETAKVTGIWGMKNYPDDGGSMLL
jgi:hypothetical protein